MSSQLLVKYSQQFPAQAELIQSFQSFYDAK